MKNALKKQTDAAEPDTTDAPAVAPPIVRGAPKMKAGDAIELAPLKDKIIAVRVESRDAVKTKFGDRSMSQVCVLVAGTKEPLEGVLFQTYFQHLPLGDWFIGRVVKVENGPWGMDSLNLDMKVVSQLTSAIATVPALSDVPF